MKRKAQLNKFEQLFRSNYGLLFSIGYRMSGDRELTQDAIQGLFLDFWEKGGLPEQVNHPVAYLQKSFTRKMLAELKKQKTPHKPLTDEIEALATPSYEELLIKFQSEKERREALRQAMEQLPPQMKEML
ncbi:MAG: sigma-70 family RNA polymerase sigma factor, partial [Bacteroidota bacterium]